MKYLFAFAILAASSASAYAADPTPAPAPTQFPSMENELDSLSLPANQAPASVADEKLYAVQNRFASLRFASEFELGGGKNFTADSYVVSNQLSLGYRFHFNDRWSVGLSGSYVFNDYSAAGSRLISLDAMVPDAAYVKYRGDLTAGFNVFYGKFRVDMDHVFYFDQYVALGPAVMNLDTGTAYGGVADAGFVFWIGKHGSIRLGAKDYVYRQQRVLSASVVNDLVGHIDLGVLLGGGGT